MPATRTAVAATKTNATRMAWARDAAGAGPPPHATTDAATRMQATASVMIAPGLIAEACIPPPPEPYTSRSRELPPAGAGDQRLDPRADLIADLPHALDGFVLGVGERPVLVGHAGDGRARRAAAHGDEHVGT